jgi:glycosidase
MTYPGAPSLFYGGEIGMRGGKDPDNRRAMIWDKARWNIPLRDYVRRCIALRRSHAALRWGTFATILGEKSIYVFVRTAGDDLCLVAFNTGDQEAVIDIPVSGVLGEDERLTASWSATTVVARNGMIAALNLAPRSGTVLTRADATA